MSQPPQMIHPVSTAAYSTAQASDSSSSEKPSDDVARRRIARRLVADPNHCARGKMSHLVYPIQRRNWRIARWVRLSNANPSTEVPIEPPEMIPLSPPEVRPRERGSSSFCCGKPPSLRPSPNRILRGTRSLLLCRLWVRRRSVSQDQSSSAAKGCSLLIWAGFFFFFFREDEGFFLLLTILFYSAVETTSYCKE